MGYAEMLKDYIHQSKFTLEELSLELEKKGLSATKQYLSRLQNGKNPPASDTLNRAIAEVTGGDAEKLIMAAYLEKAPDFVKQKIQMGEDVTKFLTATIGHVETPLDPSDPSKLIPWKEVFSVINMEEKLDLLKIILTDDANKHNQDFGNSDQYQDASETIQLLEEEARRMGMSPSDPEFIEMVRDSMQLIRMARGQNKN